MRIMDWAGPLPVIGDALQSAGGSRYRVIGIRETRPGSKSRANVDLIKLDAGEVLEMQPGQSIHHFCWCPRG
jgi:hypothetical protein